MLGGPGEGGPGPFKGGGCHSESPFLCWRAGQAPRGGNTGRGTAWQGRAPHTAPKQQSGRSGELTKSSTMGEYGVRVGELLPVSLGTLSQSRAH